MSVTKKDLIDAVIAATGCTRKQADVSIEAMLNYLIGSVKRGDDVTIKGFGKYRRVLRPARKCALPKAKGKEIPARYGLSFTCAPGLKAELEALPVETETE